MFAEAPAPFNSPFAAGLNSPFAAGLKYAVEGALNGFIRRES